MSQIRVFAMSLTWAAIASSTANAQLLPERLVPPQKFPIPALPLVDQPIARRPIGADRIAPHLWALPFGTFAGAPTGLPNERLPADWRRPVLDLPALTAESDPTRPVSPRQPFAAPAFVTAPDFRQPHKLDRFSLATDPSVRASDDPTFTATHGLLTSAAPLATPNVAPLLRLAVPDPFEHLRAIKLANPPADADAPEASQARPPLQQLSAAGPVK